MYISIPRICSHVLVYILATTWRYLYHMCYPLSMEEREREREMRGIGWKQAPTGWWRSSMGSGYWPARGAGRRNTGEARRGEEIVPPAPHLASRCAGPASPPRPAPPPHPVPHPHRLAARAPGGAPVPPPPGPGDPGASRAGSGDAAGPRMPAPPATSRVGREPSCSAEYAAGGAERSGSQVCGVPADGLVREAGTGGPGPRRVARGSGLFSCGRGQVGCGTHRKSITRFTVTSDSAPAQARSAGGPLGFGNRHFVPCSYRRRVPRLFGPTVSVAPLELRKDRADGRVASCAA